MTKAEEKQRIIQQYRLETGAEDVDLRDVSRWAIDRGFYEPRPFDPVEDFAKQLARAARAETRIDEETGRPYRANLAIKQPGTKTHLWVDIDVAPRPKVHRALTQRREQIVSDVVQLAFDQEHWNRTHPEEEPIDLPQDYTFDAQLRMFGEEDAA